MEKNKGFVSVEAHKGRTIAARLLPGTDLVTGIEAVCRAHHVQYGYFGSVMGSLRQATYVIAVPEPAARSSARKLAVMYPRAPAGSVWWPVMPIRELIAGVSLPVPGRGGSPR